MVISVVLDMVEVRWWRVLEAIYFANLDYQDSARTDE